MAQLYRFLNIEDRYKSEIFTFMLPSSFILDADSELKSRDFSSNNQKWSLLFSKQNGLLNVNLIIKSISENMIVTADFCVTLINREHFTRNDTFMEKNIKFTHENYTHGRKAFASVDTLCTLDFMDERGCIQCELEIRNVYTAFSYQSQIPLTPAYNRNPAELKFLSTSIMFGNYEWNVCIQPRMDSVGSITCLKFYLMRLSALDHLCRIAYRFKFINGAFVHDSGIIEQYSDINGNSNSYRMEKVKELLQLTGKFVVKVELLKIFSVFPILLYPFSNPNDEQVQSQTPIKVYFHDRDKQTWMMESYIEDNCFILRLFYVDINNIPSGYVRLMSFNIAIRHHTNGLVYVFKKPIIKYYSKKENDDGLEITTTIDVNDIVSPNGGYLDQNGGISVEMEYYYSHLLHQPEYSNLDDIVRKQKIQMLREIQTLQTENYSLEKQLHSYQQSISNTSRTKSFDNPSVSSASSASSTQNPSLTLTNINNSTSFSSAPSTPHVVRKYMEQKYANSPNQIQDNNKTMTPSPTTNLKNGKVGSGITQPPPYVNTFNQSSNTSITNLTSQFTSGLANLKLSAASKIPTNKITSKIMNPFS